MVTNYSVPRLTAQTPESAQAKLTKAIKGVSGVESVTLKTGTQQFEVKGKDRDEPKVSDILAASKKAGFDVKMPSGKKN